MPPGLRVRSTIKNPNAKKTPSAIAKKPAGVQYTKKPKLIRPFKPRHDDSSDSDDEDFVKSDAESVSSALVSSESEEEEEEEATPTTSAKDTNNTFLLRADRLITNQFKLVDALIEIIRLKDILLADNAAEIERLKRMVRSLEIQ